MARRPRLVLPGQPQHVIHRGNNRQAIFCTLNDYEYYLEKLCEASKEYKCGIHAYVLMTNHVHLLVSPELQCSISKMMQTLGRYYVPYFNAKYRRTGTLFEGRYKASLVSTEDYLFYCMRYIELNPVRAQMANHPSEYRWSSYHHNALGAVNLLITPHYQYEKLGFNPEERQRAYIELFKGDLNNKIIHEIRQASNKGCVLGDDLFKSSLENQLGRKVVVENKGGDRKSKLYKKGLGVIDYQ